MLAAIPGSPAILKFCVMMSGFDEYFRRGSSQNMKKVVWNGADAVRNVFGNGFEEEGRGKVTYTKRTNLNAEDVCRGDNEDVRIAGGGWWINGFCELRRSRPVRSLPPNLANWKSAGKALPIPRRRIGFKHQRRAILCVCEDWARCQYDDVFGSSWRSLGVEATWEHNIHNDTCL